MSKKHSKQPTPSKTGIERVTYSEETAEMVCDKIAESNEGLNKICKEPGMPSQKTIMKWLATYPDFVHQYAHAHARRADRLAAEILEIADDGSNDTYTDSEGNERVDFDNVHRSKLRVDARKWLAAKLAPKKYGDNSSVDVTTGGERVTKFTFEVVRPEDRKEIEGEQQ